MREEIIIGDCVDVLAGMAARGERVQAVVTSPPYWGLRDYKVEPTAWPAIEYAPLAGLGARVEVGAQTVCLGLEERLEDFVGHVVHVFRLVREVLADDGLCWVNMGDAWAGNGAAYGDKKSTLQGRRQAGTQGATRFEKSSLKCGLKPKDMMMLPARVALALQADGWWLRQEVVWAKPNPMPESVRDRCTKAHEMVYVLTKRGRYYWNAGAIAEPSAKPERVRADVVGGKNGHLVRHSPGGLYEQGPPRSWNGSRKEAVEQTGAPVGTRRGQKIPGGWDTGAGGHGTIHREGRTEAQYNDRQDACPPLTAERKQDALGKQTYTGFNDRYRESGGVERRNKRDVWWVATQPFPEAHFAPFPEALVEPMVLASTRRGDVVLDPFGGSGTVGRVAARLGRGYVLIERGTQYEGMIRRRVDGVQMKLV